MKADREERLKQLDGWTSDQLTHHVNEALFVMRAIRDHCSRGKTNTSKKRVKDMQRGIRAAKSAGRKLLRALHADMETIG